MDQENANFVDVSQLRVGMFIELDMGWMAHPFPTSSFKISLERQIETLRSMGLKRVRHVPAKSDPLPELESKEDTAAAQAALDRAQTELGLQQARQQRAELLAAQQRSLVVCERRFGESVRQYRKAIEQMHSQPKVAAEQCQSLVNSFVLEMLDDGETSIRLLSESAGDKASMHSVNVTIISLLLGKAMGLAAGELQDLGIAAFLHDVGKLDLPDRMRWHEDSFSSAEAKLYQGHVGLSVQMARTMELPKGALLAIAQHHEMSDGTGFPSRIKSETLCQAARILALVNRYDNLCNPNRPAAAMTPHEALSLIFAQLKSQFDSVTLSAFIRMMGVYPPGSVVQLADERYASVVSVNSSRPLKPRVVVYEPGISKHEALILDLERVPTVSVRRSIKPTNLPAAAMDYLAPRQRISYFFERVADTQALGALV